MYGVGSSCVCFIVVCLLGGGSACCGTACVSFVAVSICCTAWRYLRNCTVLRLCVNCNRLDESFILNGSPYA